jgi:hypothetical protein
MNGSMLSCNGTIVSCTLFYEFSYSVVRVTVTQKTLCSEPARCADTCHSCLLCLDNDIVLRSRTAILSLTWKFRWRSQSTSGNLQTLLRPIVRVSLLGIWLVSVVNGMVHATVRQSKYSPVRKHSARRCLFHCYTCTLLCVKRINVILDGSNEQSMRIVCHSNLHSFWPPFYQTPN